jgi:hypothetical protein
MMGAFLWADPHLESTIKIYKLTVERKRSECLHRKEELFNFLNKNEI